uniref:Putative secreted protein n=1 Tax=Anopheles darlingi TaxID=43151 RepID=A0A2M4D318_ANODA
MVMFIVVLIALQNADRVVASRSCATRYAAITTIRRHNASHGPFLTFRRRRGHTHSLMLGLIQDFRATGILRRTTIQGFLERCIIFITLAFYRLTTRCLIANRATG